MRNRLIISVVAIICITILEAIALSKGIDGAMLMSALSIIGGIAGYKLRETIEINKRRKKR